ncbi:hypothetical protein CJ030_MR7G013027 [Morella rubra]|uniref:Uncharacterized protein n=1 Tax=Morella rubra TaxID=262757 RepID=A0A6A1V7G2_9ROSI|nr:hypothetical protein CJ030_MR7G013027 [Morella rubra]
MAQWESNKLEAEARLVRESKLVSNPTQQQLSSTAPSLLINKTLAQPAVLPPCLDIFKAWEGVWSKSMIPGIFPITGDDLESPTSTLNFSAENGFHVQSVALGQIYCGSHCAFTKCNRLDVESGSPQHER